MEDSVTALYRLQTRGSIKSNGQPKLPMRILGYLWLVLWMAWSMPVWTYPVSRRDTGEGILPFSFLTAVHKKK